MSVDQVFAALADPTRRQLLEALAQRPPCSATALAEGLPVSRQAVAKHLVTLRHSQLVTSHRAGKEVLFSVCPDQLTATASWMTTLAATWTERLQLLKQQAEQGQAGANAPPSRRPG
jgi:DNA-binding transcriptional ArsR family regulator